MTNKKKLCANCGRSDPKPHPCEGGYICDQCIAQYHAGRDVTTRAVKSFKNEVVESSNRYPTPIPKDIVPDSKETPHHQCVNGDDQASLDASAHRIGLLTRMGNDCVAMAIDAATSIKAENSLEKMLAHQLAVAHKSALEVTDKAFFEEDASEKVKLLNLAARLMDTFQRGLLTFQRLRTGGEQRVIVQHLNLEGGAQAVIGNVKAGVTSK